MHALEDRTHILNTMYNQMPWPMLMLDERMQCLECNPAARQGLREGAVTLQLPSREEHIVPSDLTLGLLSSNLQSIVFDSDVFTAA